MKSKYTVVIAGVTLNILSDADEKSMETITNQLNKRMTEILSKSNNCPVENASLLCSMSLLAERNKMVENCNRMENELFQLTADKDALEREIANLEKQLEDFKKNGVVAEEKGVVEEVAPYVEEEIFAPTVSLEEEVKEEEVLEVQEPIKEEKKEIIDELVEDRTDEEKLIDDGILNPVKKDHKQSIFDEPMEEETPAETKKTNASKVGEMFDFLTFSDV